MGWIAVAGAILAAFGFAFGLLYIAITQFVEDTMVITTSELW